MSWGIVQDMNNNFFQGLTGTTYTFTVIDETRAWCDPSGTVVSFTNLRLSQTRNGPPVLPGGQKPKGTAACDSYKPHTVFEGF